MAENVFETISSRYYDLTGAEKKTADYVLANKEQCRSLSIAALASRSGVAEATVSRFCRRLGYSGYNAFKLAIAGAAAPQEEEPQQTIEEPEEAQEEEGAEADDDAEAPEIDVMAGIVQGGPEEEPKKPARAKSTAKKTTGRRKSG